MNNNNRYTILYERFFTSGNLKWYSRKYPDKVNKYLTKKKLWNHIFNEAWKLDEQCFRDEDDNELFYILKLSTYYNDIIKLNSNFNIVLYIFFNLDLVSEINYLHKYLQHYLVFGHKENRICDIQSYKSFDLNFFVEYHTGLSTMCNCVYDYIYHFVHIDRTLKCTDKPAYDNSFTIVNDCSLSIKYIRYMKYIMKNKRTKNDNVLLNELELFNKIKFNVIKKDKKQKKHVNNELITSSFDTSSKILYNNFPFIFNKYILGLTKPSRNIPYIVDINNNRNYNNITTIVHLHCMNIGLFSTFYGDYINIIHGKLSPLIIVTYSLGTLQYNLHPKIILIKIPNKGMDIGAKIIVMDYISTLNIKYNYVFFLHSKSDKTKRMHYYSPFFDNVDYLYNSIQKNKYMGYFPPVILNGDYYHIINNNGFKRNVNVITARDNRNKILFNNFCELFHLDNKLVLFPEGNNFILSKDIAVDLYKPEFYNLLNDSNSFDAHWVMIYYSLHKYNIYEIYTAYKEKHMYGNNIQTNLGHRGHADSQIEHCFERLIFNIIQKKKGSICILPSSKESYNTTKALQDTINYSYLHGHVKLSDKELILSNISIMSKETLTIIACHTNSQLKIQCLLHNISVFLKISKKIIIYNSLEFKSQYIEQLIKENFPDKLHQISFFYIENDCFVCHRKWYEAIKNEYNLLHTYKSFILTNDSYLYVKSKDIIKNFINHKYEMQTMLISNENYKHYTDFLRIYNYSGVLKIYKFYDKFIRENKDISFQEIINELEMKSHTIFSKKNGLFEENDPININFIEPYREKYMSDTDYPIVKIKALAGTSYSSNTLPNDFDPSIYKFLNNDLHNLTNDELIQHFIHNGMKEGRLYKNNQLRHPPYYLENILRKLNIDINQ